MVTPIKEKNQSQDQKDYANENAIDQLAEQAEHDHALESKHYEVFSPKDYKLKEKLEQTGSKKEQKDRYVETIIDKQVDNRVNRSHLNKLIEESKKRTRTSALNNDFSKLFI